MSIENFLIKKGIAKTKNQANAIMVVIIIICLIYVFSNLFGGKGNKNIEGALSPEEMALMNPESFQDIGQPVPTEGSNVIPATTEENYIDL